MTQTIAGNLTATQVAEAEKAAQSLEALVSRLGYDEAFATALKTDPRRALASAGLTLEKEAMETLMAVDPERFDRACEMLFELVDDDFLISMFVPSCG